LYIDFQLDDLNYYLFSCSNEETDRWGSDCFIV